MDNVAKYQAYSEAFHERYRIAAECDKLNPWIGAWTGLPLRQTVSEPNEDEVRQWEECIKRLEVARQKEILALKALRGG